MAEEAGNVENGGGAADVFDEPPPLKYPLTDYYYIARESETPDRVRALTEAAARSFLKQQQDRELIQHPYRLEEESCKNNPRLLRRLYGYYSLERLERDFETFCRPHWGEVNRSHGKGKKSVAARPTRRSLTDLEEFKLVLMRVRTGRLLLDIAHLFGLSGASQASELFRACVPVVRRALCPVYLRWLPRDDLYAITMATMRAKPDSLPVYGDRPVFAYDNTEFIIKESLDFNLQYLTWSPKLHKFNSLKLGLAAATDTRILFVPPVTGGRTEEWKTFEDSPELQALVAELGNVAVSLDRGFDNLKDLPPTATKVIPAYMHRGQDVIRTQFTPEEVKRSLNISRVRACVEVANRRLKENLILSHMENTMLESADDIIQIACCIANFRFYQGGDDD